MFSVVGIVDCGGAVVPTDALQGIDPRIGAHNRKTDVVRWRHANGTLVAAIDRSVAEKSEPFPAAPRSARCVVAGSARVDNRVELAASLGLQGGPPSDLNLIAEAFDRWGSDCFDRLRGDFGVAIFDIANRRLVLASDPFATVPLFYRRQGSRVTFSTDIATLRRVEGGPPLSELAIAYQIVGAMSDHAITAYEGILRVPRAAFVVHDADSASTRVYWRPGRARRLRLPTDDHYVASGRAVLDEVVAGHLRSRKPIGVMLSGGLDSIALAATLAKLAPDRAIHGYTTVPCEEFVPDPLDPMSGSDRPNVERLQRHYPNLRVTYVADKVSPVDDTWRDAFRTIGLPVPGSTLMARRMALMQAAAGDGVRVLMTGDGGNTTLSWDGIDLLAHLARSGRWLSLFREATALSKAREQSRGGLLRTWVLREMAPRRVIAAIHRLKGTRARPFFSDHFLSAAFAEDVDLERQAAAGGMNPQRRQVMRVGEIRAHMLEFLQPQWAASYALIAAHRGMTMATPLRDRRIVDFSLAVPPEQYLRGGVSRWLVKRILEDRVPPDVLEGAWNGHAFPDAMQVIETWRPQFLERLDALEASPLASRMLDLPRLRAALSRQLPKTLRDSGERRMELLLGIPDALHIGSFLQWTEGSNR